jgi:hypothetical protein
MRKLYFSCTILLLLASVPGPQALDLDFDFDVGPQIATRGTASASPLLRLRSAASRIS